MEVPKNRSKRRTSVLPTRNFTWLDQRILIILVVESFFRFFISSFTTKYVQRKVSHLFSSVQSLSRVRLFATP